MSEQGHEIKITTRDKDVTVDLLNSYGLDYELVGKSKKGIFNKMMGVFKIEYNISKVCKNFNPDIFLGASGNFYVAHVATLFRKPSIIFEDSEPDRSVYLLCKPFATYFCTPLSFEGDLGSKKHIRYNGYKELAYLHPNHFKPDSSILEEIGIKENEKFTLLRFVAWSAGHDVGHKGFSPEDKIKLVDLLSNYGKVFITSEDKLSSELDKYKLPVKPDKLHDLLSYAHMFIGDSQTMSTEASILGVPAIRSNSFVGTMSNFRELEETYGLMYSFKDTAEAFDKIKELQEDLHLKEKWQVQKNKLLNEKMDVTEFIVDIVNGYPEHCKELASSSRNI